ncbi:MAG: type II toxin-antitoxin system RelE/ParE family toxin [Defluviitaleaceae bacterium]|nr:type II toxin-antitoxin system RelE/ParE family toxin [Defluviitaleaceae bacterium]
MYRVFTYTDKYGRSPIESYIGELMGKGDKDSRINANKIRDHVAYLREHGAQAREPYAKHLDGDIWEIRPIRNRILYAAWDGNSFILLHLFKKDTQKTPRREIEQAKRNLADYRERSKDNG